MTGASYAYRRLAARRYVFTSVGKKEIDKAVEFVSLGVNNIFNLGFGDVLPDGSIDDMANSNNGDIVMVLATVVAILKDFVNEFPKAEVYFSGSTDERTRLYARILRSYYASFSKEFVITAIVFLGDGTEQIVFDPNANREYLGFLIKRIN